MYRGFWLHSLLSAPTTASTLILYDFYRDYLFKIGQTDLYSRYVLIGLASTATNQLLFHPFDTVRRSLQADSFQVTGRKVYQGAKDCFLSIYRQEGIQGLYRGLGVNLVKTPLSTVFNLMAFEYFRQNLSTLNYEV